MTSLAAMSSADARGPAAIYLISDSRVTWGSATSRWDSVRKLFASKRTPDIFGFCGDAFVPSILLNQVIMQADAGLLLIDGQNASERHRRFLDAFKAAFQTLVAPPARAFSILHGSRDGENMSSNFLMWEIRYDPVTATWSDAARDIVKDQSYMVHVDGTGKAAVLLRAQDWAGSLAAGTSRSLVWAFCDSLRSGTDPFTGGPPQLVGIWRVGSGRSFGFIWENQRFYCGLEVRDDVALSGIDWFNDNFERCDGRTKMRMDGAQAQPRTRA